MEGGVGVGATVVGAGPHPVNSTCRVKRRRIAEGDGLMAESPHRQLARIVLTAHPETAERKRTAIA
jgi:hypothetical protein